MKLPCHPKINGYYLHQTCSLHLLGTSGGGEIAGREAVESGSRRARGSRSMAENLPDPHYICFWAFPRLAASRLGLRALCFVVEGTHSLLSSPEQTCLLFLD
eukprot:1148333-Pelagomonas_calceolata.AAC.2